MRVFFERPRGGPAGLHLEGGLDDENRLTLNGLLKSGIARFGYTYDFGDTWEHAVAIEKTQPAANGSSYPACVAGKRNCPPEDCGGSWGYQHLTERVNDFETAGSGI